MVQRKPSKLKSRILKKLNWGIAGVNQFVETNFMSILQQLKRSNINSIVTLDKKITDEFARKYSIKNSSSNFDEFLESDIDIIYFPESTMFTVENILASVEKNKMLLINVPSRFALSDIKLLGNILSNYQHKIIVNFFNRFHPHLIKAKELIETKLLGKIIQTNVSIHVFDDNDTFFPTSNPGNGVLKKYGVHAIDILRYLNGDGKFIFGKKDNVFFNLPVEDYATGKILYNNGAYGSFDVSSCSSKTVSKISIIGQNGDIFIENFLFQKYQASKLIIELKGEAKKVFRKRSNLTLNAFRNYQKIFLGKKNNISDIQNGLINLEHLENLERFD